MACWTPMYSIGKRAMVEIDAFALASIRYTLGVMLLAALLVATEGWRALRYDGRAAPAWVLGFIGVTGWNLLMWLGLVYTRPEHAAIIAQLQTPLAALAAWFSRGQRPAPFTLACAVAAFAGVIVVVTKGNPFAALEGGSLFGDFLVFLGSLAWVIYSLGAGRFAGWSPLRMTVLTCIPGCAGILGASAVALALGASSVPSAQTLNGLAWQLAYFAVCSMALGVLAFNAAARDVGPLNTILMLNLVPVGVFAIEAALGQRFSVMELAGAVIVVGALVCNNLYLRR